jgi:hypothetical protein
VWVPRATADVDLNLFVAPEQLAVGLAALADAGVRIDMPEATRLAAPMSAAGWSR